LHKTEATEAARFFCDPRRRIWVADDPAQITAAESNRRGEALFFYCVERNKVSRNVEAVMHRINLTDLAGTDPITLETKRKPSR